MDNRELLDVYNYKYGNEYKIHIVQFLIDIIGEDAEDYWLKMHSSESVSKYLEENHIKEFDDQVKFLEDKRYMFDGYKKSCEYLNSKNYKDVPEFIKERIEFMISYSHVMLMVIINCIVEILKEFGVELEGASIIDYYIIYIIEKFKDEKFKESHSEEYRVITVNKSYYNTIISNLTKAKLL